MPITTPEVMRSDCDFMYRNNGAMKTGNNPRIKFGAEIVAVARKFVPNRSETNVTNKERYPIPMPMMAQRQ